jgi:hypothetical protein
MTPIQVKHCDRCPIGTHEQINATLADDGFILTINSEIPLHNVCLERVSGNDGKHLILWFMLQPGHPNPHYAVLLRVNTIFYPYPYIQAAAGADKMSFVYSLRPTLKETYDPCEPLFLGGFEDKQFLKKYCGD